MFFIFISDNNANTWIGGTDMAYEGVWEWHTGSCSFDIADWAPNNPTNSDTNSDCLMLLTNRGGQWGDRRCSGVNSPFICEYRQ